MARRFETAELEDLVEPLTVQARAQAEQFEPITRPAMLLPPGIEVSPLGSREYAGLRIDRFDDFEQNADTVELWFPRESDALRTAERVPDPGRAAPRGLRAE